MGKNRPSCGPASKLKYELPRLKAPKCMTCGSMSWRVEGKKCKGKVKKGGRWVTCGLEYREEKEVRIQIPSPASALGWGKMNE